MNGGQKTNLYGQSQNENPKERPRLSYEDLRLQEVINKPGGKDLNKHKW